MNGLYIAIACRIHCICKFLKTKTNELSKNRFGTDFNTFFLRVLNTGIPTILIGNPLAFSELKTSSQLMSRLSDPGQYTLCPHARSSNQEWCKDLVPKLWGKNLLPEPDEPIENIAEFLLNKTGGFTHYLSVLRRETLRTAIEANASRVTMIGHLVCPAPVERWSNPQKAEMEAMKLLPPPGASSSFG